MQVTYRNLLLSVVLVATFGLSLVFNPINARVPVSPASTYSSSLSPVIALYQNAFTTRDYNSLLPARFYRAELRYIHELATLTMLTHQRLQYLFIKPLINWISLTSQLFVLPLEIDS